MNMPNRVFALLFCFLLAALGEGRNIYVSLEGTNNFPYTNWPSAATNIQWAVSAGTNGDTVWISNGTYVLTNYITVNSNITIRGVAGDTIVVDGNTSNRCFYVPADVEVGLSNLFIIRGNVTNAGDSGGHGGGLMVRGSVQAYNCVFSNNSAINFGGGMCSIYESAATRTNIMRNSTFIRNTAGSGGGIYAFTGPILVDNCLFHTNSATQFGGMISGNNIVKCTITGSYFTCNQANNAGGVRLENNSIMTHSTIASNYSSGSVGGIQCFADALITNCTISENSGWQRGGFWMYQGGTVKNCLITRNVSLSDTSSQGSGGIHMYQGGTVQNCIIEENISSNFGGGVVFEGGTLLNCLIRNNVATKGGGLRRYGNGIISGNTIVSNYASSASTGGGGIYDDTTTSTGAFDNCIIYLNECATAAYSNYYISGALTSYTNCLVAPALSGSATTYSTNNITADPQFIDREASNYRLRADSPCVNTGVNRDWMTNAVDLDGRTRIRYDTVDMGAYEFIHKGTIFGFR